MNYPFGRNILLSTVGFDRLLNAFTDLEKSVSENRTASYPPYNILKVDETNYEIQLAVAGFSQDEIEISVENNKLSILGKLKAARDAQYLHRGIATRDFSHDFTLADTVVVEGADMRDGLLIVRLQNVVPETAKPRRIEIGVASEPKLVDNRQAA